MSVETGNFTAEYVRSYGVVDFELHDGQPVSIVSEPTYEEFVDTLTNASYPKDAIILTPELMTSPYYLNLIPENTGEIMKRTIEIQGLSTRPNLIGHTVLLGTASFANSNEKPTNSLVMIKDGMRFADYPKRFMPSIDESSVFSCYRNREASTLCGSKIGTLICADIMRTANWRISPDSGNYSIQPPIHPFIHPEVESLFISSCWAVTLHEAGQINDERFRQPLETKVGHVFQAYPRIREIIMADRAVPESGTSGPFNAHFKRAN